MKVLNLSEGTVFLDDINVAVLYSRDNAPFEIADLDAAGSRALRYAISSGLLMDVTKGIPTEIPRKKDAGDLKSQESPFLKRQDVLVKDDHSAHAHGPATRPRVIGPSAMDEFKIEGRMSVAYEGPACFPAGAKIFTRDGAKPIEEVKVGDFVLTDKGRMRMVTSVFERQYAGKIVSIRTVQNNEEIVLTEDHRLFVVKGSPCKHRKATCKPSCRTKNAKITTKYGTYSYCPHPPSQAYATEIMAAKEVDDSCFLVIPRQKTTSPLTSVLLSNFLGDYKKFSHDDCIVWPSPKPMSTCKSTIARRRGIPVSHAYGRKSLTEKRRFPEYDALARQGIAIPNSITLTRDFGRFIGLYLAEGSSNTSTSFAFHEKETNLIKFVRRFTKSILGLETIVRHDKKKHCRSVNVHNVILAKFLRNCCGHDASSKKLPSWSIDAGDEFVNGLILGLWEGDGTKPPRKKDNSIKFGSASPSLAYGMTVLLSRFGVSSSIFMDTFKKKTFGGKTYRYDKEKVFYVVGISGQQLYSNEWLKRFEFNVPWNVPRHPRERNHYVTNDYVAVKVMSKNERDFSGLVYNIEVEEDHSYTVNGKAVKNCDAGGYALMNRRFMLGLEKKGVNVHYEMLPSMPDMDPATMSNLKRLVSNRVPSDTPKIYGMTAPLHYDWARYKMLFTMMETRRLHKDYAIRCNCADEVIVPSRWCRDVFAESGVKKPMTVVPLGVDTKQFKPGVEPIAFSKNLKPFVFLSVFGWSLRKGYDVLLKAFFEEFTGDDPVSLVLSTRYFGSTDESKKQVIRDEIAKIRSMTSNKNQPHLVFFGDVLSDEMMPRLFAAADCYVLISRGEGFGLPYIQAGACGLPVIASRYSGQTDFLDDSNSYLVDVDGFRSAEKELAWISYFYEDAEFPIFGEKSVEQTRVLMRHVFEHQEEAKAKAGLLRSRILKEYDWSTCVDQMYDKLKLTYGELIRR